MTAPPPGGDPRRHRLPRRHRRLRRNLSRRRPATAPSASTCATPSRTAPSRSRCSRCSPPSCSAGCSPRSPTTACCTRGATSSPRRVTRSRRPGTPRSGTYVALFEGSVFNPHTVAALFQQASMLHRDPRRLPVRRVRPAVRDRGPGDAADPGRARRGAAVPGRHVQHRRAEPVHRRRHHGRVARLRGQPAVLRARGGLRARRVRRRRGDRLAGRRDQGAHRGARGDRHDHAQLRHGVLPRLPALLAVADAGARRVQHHHPGDRVERAPAADSPAPTCASTPAS